MDFNSQELLKGQNNNIGEPEDRISNLPDPLLHSILSFLGTRVCARTSVLSKRWNHIWTSIPTLDFSFEDWAEYPSLTSINKFMDFVDTTFHLHDTAVNIQNFSLDLCSGNMNASRVHSWIKNLTRRNVEELSLRLYQDECFPIPLSLFTCASLTKLELCVGPTIHFPKNISFPKLKSLTLIRVQFTYGCWNEQLFSNCPVLEELCLRWCTWFGIRNFNILSPSLESLEIDNFSNPDNGLQDCNLNIHVPSLISFSNWSTVAKDYDLSDCLILDRAVVYFSEILRESRIVRVAAISKFLRALSHVRCLTLSSGVVKEQVISAAYDFVNNLPIFHNLSKFKLLHGATTDKLLFALLKAAPNLKWIVFERISYALPFIPDEKEYVETEELFQHLQSVGFEEFSGEARELRWAELILKNAKSLQTMTIAYRHSDAEYKEVFMPKLQSIPRASGRCVIKFVESLW